MQQALWPKVPAPFIVPIGATLLLCVGALAAGLHGAMAPGAVTACCALVTGGLAVAAEPVAAVPLAVIAWFTAAAFEATPYGTLHPGTRRAAIAAGAIAAAALVGVASGLAGRMATSHTRGGTLEDVGRLSGLASAVDRRRQLWAVALAAIALPGLTVVLAAARDSLSLDDELLLFLLAVVAVAVVGGFWPAIAAATAASLILNWYFTEPLHTFTIAKPDNLLALLLFVLVAVSVSSVVHLAARRSIQARQSRAEAEALLQLARTVLGGDDTADAVLGHLHAVTGKRMQLLELVGSKWVRIASVGRDIGDEVVLRQYHPDVPTADARRVPVGERPPAVRHLGGA